MKKLLISVSVALVVLASPPTPAEAGETVTVAVIDTGVDADNPHLCKYGHRSFVDSKPLVDTNGHGTHIAGLIAKEAGDNNYCIVSLKYYDDKNTGAQNIYNTKRALRHAIDIGVNFINYSSSGIKSDREEYALIKEAISKGIVVVAAAGNDGVDTSHGCQYYPACYDLHIVVVGNMQDSLSRAPSSNFGTHVNRWEVGTNVLSTYPGHRYVRMSGTSQATAVATGKLIKDKLRHAIQ